MGHLGLTASEQADLVDFLKFLTDGFTWPNPVNSPRDRGEFDRSGPGEG